MTLGRWRMIVGGREELGEGALAKQTVLVALLKMRCGVEESRGVQEGACKEPNCQGQQHGDGCPDRQAMGGKDEESGGHQDVSVPEGKSTVELVREVLAGTFPATGEVFWSIPTYF